MKPHKYECPQVIFSEHSQVCLFLQDAKKYLMPSNQLNS